MTILKNSTARSGAESAELFQEDFPVSRSASQEKEKAIKTTVSSGQKCFELLAKFDRNGSSPKTSPAYYLLTAEWYSSASALTWKISDTPLHRLLFRLAPSARRTGETGFGLLPTPTRWDGKGGGANQIGMDGKKTTGFSAGLKDLAHGTGFLLYPTFVEEMMGYPIGWTELPLSEILLSRRSRSRYLKPFNRLRKQLKINSLLPLDEGIET